MCSAQSRKTVVRLLCALLLLLGVTSSTLFADTSQTKDRKVTKLGDGIYTIRHPDAPDTFPQGNTTVIIGDRDVLVVDSCYLPSSAREDIAQIKQWTNKPVRYLLNTHWHYDHTMGNSTYVDAFPGIAVIAQKETQKEIAGYNPGWFERFPTRATQFQEILNSGKDRDGKALTEGEREDYKKALAGLEPVQAEYRLISAQLSKLTPNVAFDRELNIDLGNREVQIRYFGRGNTAGDAVAYLPKEKILVTGDLLDHPVPYLGGGYPKDLARTLTEMSALDTQTIVPGHGEVLQGKVYLNDVIAFVSTVVEAVNKEIYRGGNGPRHLEEVKQAVQKNVDLSTWRQKFSGENQDDRDFFDDFSLNGLITAAYAEAWPR